MVEPISFKDIEDKFFETQIPDVVVNAINSLIIEHYEPNNKESRVKQEEILNKICNEETGYSHQYVFDHHFLDIEKLYSKYGWKVEYEAPSFGETSFKAYFVFKERKDK